MSSEAWPGFALILVTTGLGSKTFREARAMLDYWTTARSSFTRSTEGGDGSQNH